MLKPNYDQKPETFFWPKGRYSQNTIFLIFPFAPPGLVGLT